MSNATNIAQSGNVPTEWAEGVAEMKEIVKNAYIELDNLDDEAQVPTKTFETSEDGEVYEVETGETQLHPLINREQTTGLFAYRYELCADDSVVALYVKGRDGNVGMVAFDSIEDASQWSPRNEE